MKTLNLIVPLVCLLASPLWGVDAGTRSVGAGYSSLNCKVLGRRNIVVTRLGTASGIWTYRIAGGTSYSFPGGGTIYSAYSPTQVITASSGPKVCTSEASISNLVVYKSGAVWQTIPLHVPSVTATFTWGGSAAEAWQYVLGDYRVIVSADGLTAETPDAPPPVAPITTLDKFFGTDLTIPYYVQGGQQTVEVKIGGQTYTFPVEYAEGDSGGIAMLKLPIPQGWDGSAEIGGVKVALAPRTVYTGEPTMATTANPYDEAYPATLPPGMTRGIPDLPSGMTPGSYYGLPSGVTESTKLPLPSGVTQIKSGPAVGGNLTTAVTNATGANQWTATNSNKVSTGTTGGSSGGTTATVGGTGTSKEGAGTTGTEDGDKAVLDASMGAPGDDVKPGSAMSGYATQWESLKGQVQNKLGGFRPLQAGSIPKTTSLAIAFDFGSLGKRNVNFDLTQEPFVTARLLALVFVTFWAGMWFLNFIKI